MRHDFSRFLLIAAGSLLFAGCYDAERHTETAVIDQALDTVRVDVGSGDVTVDGADVADVSVTARVEGPLNHLGHSVDGGVLTLFDDCHEHHCSVDVHAVVPAGVAVEVDTGSGDIAVNRLLGTLDLHTGSGDVDGSELAAIDLSARTGSGDISLQVDDPAENVTLQTGSGNVALGVPAGSYRLRVSTGSGDQRTNRVESDDAAPGAITVHTGSGDVTIDGY
ncbi:MAG TPA: DUF4097 family beta strand repeat-containing protein [Polyangiaceae bacterium]|nr:DUF4097 family beta strand repeat-containing protein [Polyangiaceae bacterium]